MEHHKSESTLGSQFDRNMFFKIIDHDDRFNAKTKEAYWKYYTEECGQDIVRLYNDGEQLFSEKPEIHQHLRHSINKYFDKENDNKKPEASEISHKESEESATSPIVDEMKKKTAITWGYNNDVKMK